MKKVLLLLLLSLSIIHSQTVDGGFTTNINGSTFEVTLFTNMQSGSGTAGIVTLEFSYNNTDLTFPASPASGTDYVLLGDFATYQTKNITKPTSNSVRVALATFVAATSLTTSPKNVITLYFTINNTAATSNLAWITTEIVPSFIQPAYTVGNWPNSNGPLPVELTTFTYVQKERAVELNWSTATEVNNYGFEIERKVSDSENEWERLGFVEGHGNSNSPKDYIFVDEKTPNGTIEYRLKQIDINGAFEYSDILEIIVDLPQNYKLTQNYPNPFNPSTIISYELPENSLVQLKIYDILGREVATLVDEKQDIGYHNVSFNANNLSNGIYFYKIHANNFAKVKKMVLMK